MPWGLRTSPQRGADTQRRCEARRGTDVLDGPAARLALAWINIHVMESRATPRPGVKAATYAASVLAPSALTLLLLGVSFNNPRDYAFLYLSIVAVLGVASGIGPALVSAALSFALVDHKVRMDPGFRTRLGALLAVAIHRTPAWAIERHCACVALSEREAECHKLINAEPPKPR
jgi:hypothetical protein